MSITKWLDMEKARIAAEQESTSIYATSSLVGQLGALPSSSSPLLSSVSTAEAEAVPQAAEARGT